MRGKGCIGIAGDVRGVVAVWSMAYTYKTMRLGRVVGGELWVNVCPSLSIVVISALVTVTVSCCL